VDKVSPAHIVHVIESAERSWTVSKRILTSCKLLFAHACGKKLMYSNPVVGIDITSWMGPRPPVRKRVMLTEEGLCILLKDIEDIDIEIRRFTPHDTRSTAKGPHAQLGRHPGNFRARAQPRSKGSGGHLRRP